MTQNQDARAGSPRRDTFLSYAELLRNCAVRCQDAAHELQRQIRTADARAALAAEQLAAEELKLADTLMHYAAEGPDEVLTTRLQYTPDEEPGVAPATLAHAFEALLQTNEAIVAIFQRQGDATAAPRVKEGLHGVRTHVRGANTRMTSIWQSVDSL